MKTYTLDELENKILGPVGTPARDKYEYELQIDMIGDAIKQTRKARKLTQEALGEMIGVQKAQISRLENKPGNVTLDTIIRVFDALQAKIKLQVELS